MAKITGVNGAVYFNEGITKTAIADSIAFAAGATGGVDQTITSSTAGGATGTLIDFETEGYVAGMLITVSGAASSGNNGIFTINTVASGVLTVNEAVTSGTDTGTPTFAEAEPGIEVLGFYNWTLGYVGDVAETTNFDGTAGFRTYIPGLKSWTVTADKHFLTANNEVDDWVGQTVELRLYLNYVSTPSTSAPSQYWKGDTIVAGMDESVPVDALVSQNISFQGDRELTLKTQTRAWELGIST